VGQVAIELRQKANLLKASLCVKKSFVTDPGGVGTKDLHLGFPGKDEICTSIESMTVE